MKRLTMILTIIAALLAAGSCGEGTRRPEALTVAEEMMEKDPDTALKLLKRMDGSELGGRGDSALYHLLLTQAKYKCYEDITADSMIDFSADYFRGTDDKRHEMLATYYSGNRHFDLGDYASAIKCYLKAEEMAKELNDHHYTGLIDGSISQVYKKVYNTPLSLDYQERSYRAHCESQREVDIISSLSYLILAYHSNKQYQTAIEMADSALALEALSRYPEYRLNVELVKGYAQIAMRDYRNAIATLTKVSEEYSDAPAQLYRNIGMAYYSLGDTARAEAWLAKIDPAAGDENFIPWEVYADRGNYREAFNALRAEYREIDRRVSATVRENVGRAVADYAAEALREATEREASERRQKLVAGISLGLALMISAGGWIAYRRHKKARLQEVMAMVEEMRLNVAEASAADEKIEELFRMYRRRFSSVNSLCDSYFSSTGDEAKRQTALEAVERALKDFRRDKGRLHELEKCFNRCTGNLMAHFREDFPDMDKLDSVLMLLLFTGFSTSAICVILGMKLQTLYNRKSALRKIIEQTTSPLRDKYLSYYKGR